LSANEKGTILIVDDDPMNINVLSEILEDHHDILFATNGRDALRIAQDETPDLIILDIVMPEMDGYEVCSRLKANPAVSGIPVIFVTGLSNVADETKGLKIGAVDYITKPVSPPIVLMRVSNHMKLTRALSKLSVLSSTDGLTNLANRRHLDDRLKKECSGIRRPTTPLSMILLDIDYFKMFNDTYGHVAGDDCLKKISRVLSQTVQRSLDLVARYGGEEFCCLLPLTDYENAMLIANKIRENILAEKIINQGSDVSEFLTASLGVVTILPDGRITPDQFIEMADKNLYSAKAEGRNNFVGKDCTC
jgi:diguanylate cyclase (GGDEF)-like protein